MSSWFKRNILSAAGSLIDGWGWLSGEASDAVVNEAVKSTRNRPHPWSTYSNYTSWPGLTNRTYLARHLPPFDVLVPLPTEEEVQKLFQRPVGSDGKSKQVLSQKSTCLFPAFAQYLTDGFLRTLPYCSRRTTTNHEIDLCQLYGRTEEQTTVLRLKSEEQGKRGRLKSQMIGHEEFPPFYYGDGATLADPDFAALDPPLLAIGQRTPSLPNGRHKSSPPASSPPASLPPPPSAPPPPPADMTPERLKTILAVGGDRVNSTPFTAMMNTLFLREHNRVAGELSIRNPGWDDERVFQTARNIIIPLFIKIVVEDYINHITPLPFAMRANPAVAWHADWNRPNWITAEFSLLYRWHSLMPETMAWPTGTIPIADFTLNNKPLLDVGLDAAFSAAASQAAGKVGAFNTAKSLLPIESRAIKQARDNKLAPYNKYRQAFGMKPASAFEDISSNPDVVKLLGELYGHPDNVEFYPGLFAEDRVEDSPLPGLLLTMVAVDAFSQALTNPLLSEHVFNADTFTQWGLDLINSTSKLGDILARNVAKRGPVAIEMTLPGWRYGAGM